MTWHVYLGEQVPVVLRFWNFWCVLFTTESWPARLVCCLSNPYFLEKWNEKPDTQTRTRWAKADCWMWCVPLRFPLVNVITSGRILMRFSGWSEGSLPFGTSSSWIEHVPLCYKTGNPKPIMGEEVQNQGMCVIEFVGCTKSDLRVQASVANKFSRYFKTGPRNVVHSSVKKLKQNPKP